MIGEMLDGKYRITRLIGEGGMGSVYDAETVDASLRVAVKIINRRILKPGKEWISRFRREVRVASALDSDHIVKVLDSGTDARTGILYLVMEYLSGEDLQQLIDRIGPLEPHVAVRIVAQALFGLAEAHAAQIVHRDIKPANIFVARRLDGMVVVKLLDFGIAKMKADPLQMPQTTGLTASDSFLGSPLYMSPEQAQSSRRVDQRTDIWSIGSVLYCALAGRAPYQHLTSVGQLILAICTSPPPPIQDVAPWVPGELAEIVHGTLRVSPEERTSLASEILRALLPPQRSLDQKWDWCSIKEDMLTPLSNEERAVAPELHPCVVVKPSSEVPHGATEIRGGESTVHAQDGLTTKAAPMHSEYYDILDALRAEDWNMWRAARLLDMPVRALRRKVKLLGIKESDFVRRRPPQFTLSDLGRRTTAETPPAPPRTQHTRAWRRSRSITFVQRFDGALRISRTCPNLTERQHESVRRSVSFGHHGLGPRWR
jgi:serine/threonine protein kinase